MTLQAMSKPVAFKRTMAVRLILAVAVIAGAALVVPDMLAQGRRSIISTPVDLLAFYCGSKTLIAGSDPYLAEPLRTCEHVAYSSMGGVMAPNLAIPAPLPPLALAAFGFLTALPFTVAAPLWALGIILAAAVAAFATGRLSGANPFLIALAFFGGVVAPAFEIGQVAPFAIAAITLAALAMRTGRAGLAVTALCVALVEPHVALPAFAAVAIWERRARRPAVVALAAVAGASLIAGGLSRNFEYVSRVLPAHALEGLDFNSQYSLSALLRAAGVGSSAAIAIGSLSYFVAALLGIVIARLARKHFNDSAMLVLVPASLAVLGGSYMHAHQIAVALPLAIILATQTIGPIRVAAIIAAIALGIPWERLAEGPLQLVLPRWQDKYDPRPALRSLAQGWRLAEDTRLVYIAAADSRDHRTPLELLYTKLPTWFGLIAIALIAAFGRKSGNSPPTVRTSSR